MLDRSPILETNSARKLMARLITRPAARVLIVALASAALFACLRTAPANAFTVTNTGCTGSVQAPRINGYSGPAFDFAQRFAWRSPCYTTSTQVINIRYRLWYFNLEARQWQFAAAVWRTASVDRAYTGTWMPGWSGLAPGANISGDVLVEWRLTNGALIGSQYVDYNTVGDYACPLGGACRIYPDPVVGAYLNLR